MGRGNVVGLLVGTVVLSGLVAGVVLMAGHAPTTAAPATAAPPHAVVAAISKPAAVAPPGVDSAASDVTAGGPAPARIDPEQRTTFDDVHYIPPIGLRQTLDLNGDGRSIWLGRLEKLVSAKVGHLVTVSRAWAYKEKDGDTTICGAYMGVRGPIIFVYNTGGVKGTTPELYLNVDENTYSSFGCDQSSAVPLIGA